VARKTAQGDEAAAIVAAIARFEAETAAAAPPEAPVATSAWQRAALLEGVGAKETVLDSEGGGDKWLS
jgi:hypothetical protein